MRRSYSPPARAGIMVGRDAPASSYRPPFEQEYALHLQKLEDIRLVGYRYLKPPGVTKTLRAMHEERAYNEGSSTPEQYEFRYVSFQDSNGADEGRSEDSPMDFEENELEDEDEDEDERRDFSLPALDASFPSMYHRS